MPSTRRKRGNAKPDRHLHPRKGRLDIVGGTQRDQEIQRQIGDERERMRRIHRLRRHQRKNIAQVILANSGLLARSQLVEGEYMDLSVGEPLEQDGQERALLGLECANLDQAFRNLLLAVRRCRSAALRLIPSPARHSS